MSVGFGFGDSLHVSRELLSRKVADVLSRQIISGRIPDGARLVEDELAAMLKVSRAPVREALVILERERLVTSTPGRGSYVRPFTEDSIRGLFEVRTILEVRAAERAAQRIAADPGQADGLRELADRLSEAAAQGRDSEYAQRDLDIHRRIWELSGNDHLADVLGYVTALSSVLLALDAERSSDWSVDAPRRHQVLVEAVASGDPVRAGEVVREHLARAEEGALLALRAVRPSSPATTGRTDSPLASLAGRLPLPG